MVPILGEVTFRSVGYIIRKAEWDDMVWEETDITNMDAFRSTFINGKYRSVILKKCEKVHFKWKKSVKK